MKLLLTVFFLSFSLLSRSQGCNCLDDFYFIKAHIEKNHGGFNKKIKSPDEPAYKAFTLALEKEIKKDKDGRYCIGYLKKYILYLQDHHSNITAGAGVNVNEADPAAVKAFLASPAYTQTEKIAIDTAGLEKRWSETPPAGPEGIYFTAGNSYVVAIVKNKTSRRDYAGVILRSKSVLWSPGQVKFELKQVNDSLFDMYLSYKNHSLNYDQIPFRKGKLELNGWVKAGNSSKQTGEVKDNRLYSFNVLDSTATLLSIRSFDAGLTRTLDSFYAAIMPEIKKRPNLIIDVRDNSGGSDMSYKALMPLIYTDPFDSDVMEYFVTPGNIEAYEKYDSLLLQRSPGSNPPFKSAVAMMKKADPFTFRNLGSGKPNKIQYTINKGYPLKIAVLYNRNCASSCESFLFEILNSSKTIRVGENSGGYTGYGNVMTIQTPCGNTLSWTTTVYKNQWQYEFVGIPPQHLVPDDVTNWVDYAKKLLVN